ncbi:MAG: pyruvate formate lyase family protein [Thermodesulfobacteriota bacterium]|nr:pyruvate formate lyase family protein [Thermodesulfobacteriota bacterium]
MDIPSVVSREAILTDRVRKIKKAIRSPVHADWERAHHLTEYWRTSDGEPISVRRAKALDRIMSEATINIFEGELIVGCLTKHQVGTLYYPEYQVDYLKEEWDEFAIRESDRIIPPEEDKDTVFRDIAFWDGKTLQDSYIPMWHQRYGPLIDNIIETRMTTDHRTITSGRMIPNYPKVLTNGFKGLIAEVEEMIKKTPLITNEDYHKHNFWQGCIVACNAVIKLAHRYAGLARELAARDKDAKRKSELEKIADMCSHVPEGPARTFHEAVQAVYFTHLCVEMENNSYGYSFGRMDQYLYPFYKEDLEAGRITMEQAAEIIACLWMKLASIYVWWKLEVAQIAQTSNYQNITIGGRGRDGKDCSNELSRIIVEVDTALKLRQPTLSLRYHESAPDELLFTVAKDIATGGGKPAIFCENYPYATLPLLGVDKEDVSDWTPVGCVEFIIPGKSAPFTGLFISTPHCLDLVFNNGIHGLTGKEIGVRTGAAENFSDYDEFMEAFRAQFTFQVHTNMDANTNLEFTTKPDLTPLPLDSVLVDDCITRGKDFWAGGIKYDFYSCYPVGMVTTANSLFAVKKLIFENGAVSMKEMKDALAANFDGEHARIRKLAMDLPKYGNDVDEADNCLRNLFKLTTEVIMDYRSPWGRPLQPAYLGITAHYFHGLGCGATPDGRKATMPFGDGSLSAYPGTDKRGPTAVIKSATKVKPSPAQSTLFNLKFHPSSFDGPDAVKNFWHLVNTYSDLGGYHIQFNVVEKDTLIDAQANPESYQDLLIRVAGFSAYFVDLAPMMQDEIISRTEHMF